MTSLLILSLVTPVMAQTMSQTVVTSDSLSSLQRSAKRTIRSGLTPPPATVLLYMTTALA